MRKRVRELMYGYNDGKPLKLYMDTKYWYDTNGRCIYEDRPLVVGIDEGDTLQIVTKNVYNSNGDPLYSVSKTHTDTVLDPSTVVFSDTFSFSKRTYIEGGHNDSVWFVKAVTTPDGEHKNEMVFNQLKEEYRTDSLVIRIGLGNVIPGYGPITARTTSYLNASGYPIKSIKEYLNPNGGVYIPVEKHTYTYEQY